MKDTSEIALVMTCPQTQSNLHGFEENETCSPSTIALLVCADPHNIIMEFYVIDVVYPHNVFLMRSWIHMKKVVLSSYH